MNRLYLQWKYSLALAIALTGLNIWLVPWNEMKIAFGIALVGLGLLFIEKKENAIRKRSKMIEIFRVKKMATRRVLLIGITMVVGLLAYALNEFYLRG